jgi:hypothetical protein
MGWVEDSRGTPVSGALVSLFSKGMRGGGLVTFADDAGRFVVPALPAGSYTIRAVGQGLKPAAARQITVLPNQESILSLSLAGLGDLTEQEAAERRRELTWLLRHKRRSVLEDPRNGPTSPAENAAPSRERLLERLAPWLPEIGGSLELMANAPALGARGVFPGGDLLPAGSGAVHLSGKIADVASFSLGGLVAESQDTQWRMAAEFVVDPGAGHKLRAGAGYGTRFLRPISLAETAAPLDGGTVGALFLEDRWTISDRVAATAGARQSFIGFVQDKNRFDPMASFELVPASNTRLRGSVESRSLAPGGDLLTLSTLSSAPGIVFADFGNALRAERVLRYEAELAHSLGAAHVGVRAFREVTSDQLVNAFRGQGASQALRIFNNGRVAAHGVGIDLGREFGRAVRGSLTYSFGRAGRGAPVTWIGSAPVVASFGQGSFHDVSARVETFIDGSDTRLVAFYRVNFMAPAEADASVVRNARFDLQLAQGLPFLTPLTGADWEVLLAVRNLFYETDEGGTLDELAVVNPPTRVMGGISVRF